MNPSNEPHVLEHDADGIRELDNNLPLWWVWLFYLCIVFAGIYLAYYHVFSSGSTQLKEYEAEFKKGEAIKAAAIAKFESTIGRLEPSKDPAVLAQGLQTYTTWCSPCHRPDGGGQVGPNLCDTYWIHGSNYVDSVKIILNGVPEKGMLTWRGILKPSEIQAVASHIYTLRGSSPPNPKPPENTQQPTAPNEFE